ncbi:hypothetical protein CBR_g19455 [Chara braunii]|uniref:HAT C-terminal dimerisation domain-containing protein n=1 Tax=Chara braunii TaxID=69332 RepID=A0A388KY27_CHABU|nr:hypothetical protein CBR_g19455 [Chara braunii]|eukprot:GBG74941.1 hypothetical protein CBR_g19455 [Chara braunii]
MAAPELQRIALRVMYMWTCSSPAERNWAIHESTQTKKHNRLLFPKVAKLVEITTNTRLLTLQDAICEGVDHRISEEDRDAQAQFWRRDACGSRPPPPVEDVFGVRATTLRPYPKDDSSGDEREVHDEGFRPCGGAGSPRAEDDGAWSDPEELRWRSGGRDIFEDTGRGMDGVEGCWGGSGRPHVVTLGGMGGTHDRQCPTAEGVSSVVRGSSDDDDQSGGHGEGRVFQQLRKGLKNPKRQLILHSESLPASPGAGTEGGQRRDLGGGVGSGLGRAWSLVDLGTLGEPPGGSVCRRELDDEAHEGAHHDQAGLGDQAMESASMHDFMKELEATLSSMTEGEAVLAQEGDAEVVWPQHRSIHTEEPAPETEDKRMAREAREDEEEAATAKALADVDPRTQAMARNMEARRELETVRRVMSASAGAGVHRFHEDVHDMVAEDPVLEGAGATAHTQALESRGFVEEAGGDTSHADRERE